jgi:hypothetical protein
MNLCRCQSQYIYHLTLFGNKIACTTGIQVFSVNQEPTGISLIPTGITKIINPWRLDVQADGDKVIPINSLPWPMGVPNPRQLFDLADRR